MPSKAQDDDLVMSLVQRALDQPPCERTIYIRTECGDDLELLGEVRKYVEWEQRMDRFLLDPLCELASEEPPFEPGEMLASRFRIVREVGRGGMAIVYEAIDEKLERHVALKCAKVGFQQRLPPEVRHAREIAHPNVCKLFEIHTASTKHGEIDFITMELLHGETLAERLRRGPLPKPEAQVIARQITGGLAAAHHSNVLHGDLKSGNVMLTTGRDGALRAAIMDFGMARPARSDSRSGVRGGTPDYMAPELWKGELSSVVSDVYALGVILYELAAGRRPDWSNASPEDRLKPSPVDPKWDRILARCLDPAPAKRYQTVNEVAQALAPPRYGRWYLTAAAALVLAAVTGVVTHEHETAPVESVRLAVLPFDSDAGDAASARVLFRDTQTQLARLKGSRHTAVKFVRGNSDATLVLHGSLRQENGKVVLIADLTDTRSHASRARLPGMGVLGEHAQNTAQWKAAYLPSEMRYAPVALAGVVTASLKLAPLPAAVSGAARQNYAAGLAYLRRENTADAAIPVLQRAVQEDSESALTYAALAEAEWFKYYFTGDKAWLEQATESARQAELRDPDVAALHRISGLLAYNSSRYEAAETEYRRAIELEPENSDAYRRLGMALEQNNELNDALAAYRKAVELDPNYYRNYQALGAFYEQRSEYSEAEEQFQKAIELNPDQPSVRMGHAIALLNLGRFAEAEAELRTAIQTKETAQAVYTLGYALMYQDRNQQAVPYLLRALALGFPQKDVVWFQLETAYRRTKRNEEARNASRQGLRLTEAEAAQDPRSGYVRSYEAYFCARLGEQSRAESEIAQALQLSPNDSDTRELAALTDEALGRREDTLALLTASPAQMIADLNRWPDLADLRKDPRYLQLLASHQIK